LIPGLFRRARIERLEVRRTSAQERGNQDARSDIQSRRIRSRDSRAGVGCVYLSERQAVIFYRSPDDYSAFAYMVREKHGWVIRERAAFGETSIGPQRPMGSNASAVPLPAVV